MYGARSGMLRTLSRSLPTWWKPMPDDQRNLSALPLCGVICPCGPEGEPLACGYEPDHDGNHSWASIPTFVNGFTALEHAALGYVQAFRAEADSVVETGRAVDVKRPTWERKQNALGALFEEADRRA